MASKALKGGPGAPSPGPVPSPDSAQLLSVREIVATFSGSWGRKVVVDGVSFDIAPGERVGLVGESGSGKTTVASSILRILPPGGAVESGEIRLGATDILQLAESALRPLRSARLAQVPQDPLGSLNPVLTIGYQLRAVVLAHQRIGRRVLHGKIVDALRQVGIGDAEAKLRSYPHELSGGMRQRVLIAMALINDPDLLIADEPTTALDVTVQAQVIDLLRSSVETTGMALLLITHDIGVVAELCDRVMVMFDGQVVEDGSITEVLSRPMHPYSRALLQATQGDAPAAAAPGADSGITGPGGSRACRYVRRCPLATEVCAREADLVDRVCGWRVRCHAVPEAVTSPR